MEDPYTDADPEYKATPLVSAVPPPNSFSAPRLNPSGRDSRGRGRGRGARGSFNSRGRGFHQGNYNAGPRPEWRPNRGGSSQSLPRKPARTFDPSQPYPTGITGSKRERSPPTHPPSKRPAPRPRYDTSLFQQPNDILRTPRDFSFQTLPDKILDIVVVEGKLPEYSSTSDRSMLRYFHQFESQLHKREVRDVRDAMTRALPLQRLGRLQFQSSEVIQLANLDSVLPIVRPREDATQFTYIELGRCPGKFSEYILWRLPERKTFRLQGLCIPLRFTGTKSSAPAMVNVKPFHSECRVESRLKVLGSDLDSDPISVDWERAQDLLQSEPLLDDGIDLVIADIISGGESTFEYQASLLSQVLLMFETLRKGGTAVFRLGGLMTEVTHQTLWILRRSFSVLNFIRPASAGALSPSIYIVCENLLHSTGPLYNAISEALQTLESSPLVRFLSPELVSADTELLQFIRGVNQRVLLSRLDSVKLVLKMLERPTTSPIGPASLDLQQYARWEWALED